MYTLTHPHNESYRIVEVSPNGGDTAIWLLQKFNHAIEQGWDWLFVDGHLVFYWKRETFLSIDNFNDVDHASTLYGLLQ